MSARYDEEPEDTIFSVAQKNYPSRIRVVPTSESVIVLSPLRRQFDHQVSVSRRTVERHLDVIADFRSGTGHFLDRQTS